MSLTHKKIQGLKPKKSAYYEWDKEGTKGVGRLAVKVYASGKKVFTFRYFVAGKTKFIQLGRFPELSLSEAKAKSREFSSLLIQNIDPKEHLYEESELKQKAILEESRKGSIKQLFESYTNQMKLDGKRTHAQVLRALEKEVYPFIKPDTKAKDVTTQDVITILSSMIKRGADTQTNRVRSYLMAAFNNGLRHDNDPANYIEDAKFGLKFNPVAVIPKQKRFERVGEHFLTNQEVQILFDDLDNEYNRIQMGDEIRHLLKLCFLTGGQRPHELINSKWSSINWEAKTQTFDAGVSKNKRVHIFPLTESAIEVLHQQRELVGGESEHYIFPHRFDMTRPMPTSSLTKAVTRYCENTKNIRRFVPRDIRRTCKTLMGELGISAEIRNRINNHAFNDVSSKHYDRYSYLPEKRQALEVWESHLLSLDWNNLTPFKLKIA